MSHIYREYFYNHNSSFLPRVQFDICKYLYSRGDSDPAARGLELLIEQGNPKNPWVEKAYIYQAKILEELGFRNAALHVYDRFFHKYPRSKFIDKVKSMCESLGVVVIGY